MYLYPRIHPSWHKCQVAYDKSSLDQFPNVQNVVAYEVSPVCLILLLVSEAFWYCKIRPNANPFVKALLEPGDVLYVPPYWFHHVHSVTPSGKTEKASQQVRILEGEHPVD